MSQPMNIDDMETNEIVSFESAVSTTNQSLSPILNPTISPKLVLDPSPILATTLFSLLDSNLTHDVLSTIQTSYSSESQPNRDIPSSNADTSIADVSIIDASIVDTPIVESSIVDASIVGTPIVESSIVDTLLDDSTFLKTPNQSESDHHHMQSHLEAEEEVLASGSAIKISPPINKILVKDHTLTHVADTHVDPQQFDPKHLVFFKPPPNTISRLPLGSRMFVGNLSSAKTTHADVATIFAKYGNIYEIVLRGSYGFVQFDTIEACHDAIKCESGNSIQGLKFDCKVSKDRNSSRAALPSNNNNNNNNDNNRSGSNSYLPQRNSNQNDDRFQKNRNDNGRSDDRNYQRNDNRGNSRENNNRGRMNSRDRSPHGRGRNRSFSYSRSRSRSLSPQQNRYSNENVEFPLPPRHNNVPEVQIVILDLVDRNFISRVEESIKHSGFKTDNIFLSAKIPLKAVIRQMVAEGVNAVVLLERFYERDRKICVQIIGSNGSIQEFENITIEASIKLMLSEKAKRQFLPPVQAVNPLQAVLSQLISSNADPKTLMLIANALAQQQQPVVPTPVAPVFPMFNQNQMPIQTNPLMNPVFSNPVQPSVMNQMIQQQQQQQQQQQHHSSSQHHQQHQHQHQPVQMNQPNISDMLNKLKNISQVNPIMNQQPSLQNKNPQIPQGQFNQYTNQPVGYNQISNYQPQPFNPQIGQQQQILQQQQTLQQQTLQQQQQQQSQHQPLQHHQPLNHQHLNSQAPLTSTTDLLAMLAQFKK